MRYGYLAIVAIAAGISTFICMILAPNTSVWPLIVLSGPSVLACMRLPDTCYLIFTPMTSAVLFSCYLHLLLITRGRARLLAILLVVSFHAACGVATALLLPNPLY